MELRVFKGHEHPLARFQPEEVAAIKRRKQQFPACPLRALAREYHCSPTTIYNIVHGISYRSR